MDSRRRTRTVRPSPLSGFTTVETKLQRASNLCLFNFEQVCNESR
jgi:hypothetical protein